jgi:glycerol-3-phosphate dehydrogenase
MNTRQDHIAWLRTEPEIPALIIGGGVNGIGTLRDLALQGVDVLLVERGDYCAGASAASSHMAHGGIRYLENGEFRLVREAVQERNWMIRMAPHYVHPLPTVIPMFKVFSGLLNAPLKFLRLLDKPAERGALVIKIGLIFYDAFTGKTRTVPRHEFANRRRSLEAYPGLNPKIRYTARYCDGTILNPERLCLEMAIDAEAAHPGARSINYMAAVAAEGAWVILEDRLSGERFKVRPRVVINAAGPWIDLVNQNLERPSTWIGGTKGSHLVLNHPELRQQIGENELFFENKDGRIVLIFPLYDKVLIGTSDLHCYDPDEVTCTPEEEQYFLDMLEVVYPGIEVKPEQVVFRFSGVRPLPSCESSTTGQISRDHLVQTTPPSETHPYPILSLVGGKWTTFRAFAEHVTDQVLAQLGVARQTDSADYPLGGGKDYPDGTDATHLWVEGTAARYEIGTDQVRLWLRRYGTWAERIASFAAQGSDAPLVGTPGYTRRELAYLATHERLYHLDDLFLRRTMLAMLGELSPGLVQEAAQIVGEALGWSQAEQEAEIQRIHAILAKNHGVILAEEAALHST